MPKERIKLQAVQAKHLDNLLLQSKVASDRMINYFLAGYFLFGLVLAFFYDTWLAAFGIGGLSLVAYYAAKWILPDSNMYQFVLSTVLGVFMAQYIYQMHGMFEMHFAAFISSAVLITYQNWRLQIPITIVVAVHHAVFGYLQFIGFDKVYFTKLEYMDLQTFILHIVLAGTIFFICGLWAHQFKKYKAAHLKQTFQLGLLQEKEAHAEEQRKAQERIAQSEANLQTVFRNTDVAFILMDMQCNIISFNHNANEFARKVLDATMVIGKNYLDYMPADRKEHVRKAMGAVAEGKTIQYEVSYKHVNTGGNFWMLVSMHPVLDNEHRLTGISIASTDITERKNLEEQVAVERAMKQKEITDAVFTAQENERTEIGKELHDNVNQLLATSKLYMGMARTREAERDALLHAATTYVETAIEEIRKLAKNLVTPLMKNTRLLELIKGLIEDIMQVHPIQIQLIVGGFTDDNFHEKFKLNLFRMIQEQINNTLKHAMATRIEVTFIRNADEVFISIVDDGVGFDTAVRKKGVGITNIISRVELYKGEIVINSAPQQGCKMTIRFLMKDLIQHNALRSATKERKEFVEQMV